jgi:hypothetical protein
MRKPNAQAAAGGGGNAWFLAADCPSSHTPDYAFMWQVLAIAKGILESLHPTRMHESAKPMRELQNLLLLPRADHTEAHA